MEKQVFRLEETPSCFTYPFIPQGFRTARQSRFIARKEGIETSIFRLSLGNESINTQGNFLPWEWQVSDRLILVGYALFIGSFPEGLPGGYALILRKTIPFFVRWHRRESWPG